MTVHPIGGRLIAAALLGAALHGSDASAVELRLSPVASQGFGYATNVFVIEDRVERGREAEDFSSTSKLDATLVVNLANTWAAQVKYGYAFTRFLESSNTNAHGGELMLGHSVGRRLILDAGVQGTSVRVHGFRLNDYDRLAGLARLRFSPFPGETFEAGYSHGERGFPRRLEIPTDLEPPIIVFGPIEVGSGEPTARPGETQHDRENAGTLAWSRSFAERWQAKLALGYLDNGSNFSRSRWQTLSAGVELRATLRFGIQPMVGLQYARRRFDSLRVEEGNLRIDDVFGASLALKVPIRKWIGLRVQGGTLVDQANGRRGDFTSHSVGVFVNVNPEAPLVWGRRP